MLKYGNPYWLNGNYRWPCKSSFDCIHSESIWPLAFRSLVNSQVFLLVPTNGLLVYLLLTKSRRAVVCHNAQWLRLGYQPCQPLHVHNTLRLPTILTARATEKRKLADNRFSRLKRGGMLRLIICVCIWTGWSQAFMTKTGDLVSSLRRKYEHMSPYYSGSRKIFLLSILSTLVMTFARYRAH